MCCAHGNYVIIVFPCLVNIVHDGTLLRRGQSVERVGNTGTETTFDSQPFPSPHAVRVRNEERFAKSVRHVSLTANGDRRVSTCWQQKGGSCMGGW